ncbi:hypothetical protein ACH4ND_01575 [Streptomyces sp. NPDC017179]|uniref:hypothetical protein n=1 Tax=Streptomyces sp. NPDC017179 TaxID=3364979 RepID=UPI003789066C
MTTESDVTFEPAKWYEITARDNTETCRNSGKEFTFNPFYSNDGRYVPVQCGVCGQPMEITSAVLLDPQPEVV